MNLQARLQELLDDCAIIIAHNQEQREAVAEELAELQRQLEELQPSFDLSMLNFNHKLIDPSL